MATGVGSVGPPLAAARTSDQECQWPFALMVAAIAAGAAASTSPAATAAMFRGSSDKGEDRKQVPGRGLAEQAEERQAGRRPDCDPGRADDCARQHLEPYERWVVDRGVEQDLERALRLLPPDPNRPLDRFEQGK